MTADDILKLVFGAVILGFALISRFVKAQRANTGGAPVADAPAAAPPPAAAAVPQQRVLALLAEMRRRGITPPPALQALAVQAAPQPAYSPTPAYAAQPAYTAPPPSKHRHKGGERPPDRPRIAAPETAIASMPLPGTLAPAAAPRSSTGLMLARAFGDPTGARNAIILAEVLKPPVALR